MVREWYAAKADRATWDDERYPMPPAMKRPCTVNFEGSWADIQPSYLRFDRQKYRRGQIIKTLESKQKLKHLNKRRQQRLYSSHVRK